MGVRLTVNSTAVVLLACCLFAVTRCDFVLEQEEQAPANKASAGRSVEGPARDVGSAEVARPSSGGLGGQQPGGPGNIAPGPAGEKQNTDIHTSFLL